jgi:hypothetical protein
MNEIWHLLECDAVWSIKRTSMFQRNVLPAFTGYEIKQIMEKSCMITSRKPFLHYSVSPGLPIPSPVGPEQTFYHLTALAKAALIRSSGACTVILTPKARMPAVSLAIFVPLLQCQTYFSIVKMKAVRITKRRLTYHTIRCHISDNNLHSHRREGLKSHRKNWIHIKNKSTKTIYCANFESSWG